MRAKYLIFGVGAVLLASGLWFGRMAWRAHRRLVTLDVRGDPLPDVLAKIEHLTWTNIRAEKSLDGARLTLHVSNMPLRDVLDRIAEQAGATWSTVYAVYDSDRALEALESALNGDGKLNSAGWKRIAPQAPDSVPDGPGKSGPAFRQAPAVGANAGPGEHRQMLMTRNSRNGSVAFFGGPAGQMEMWSPEELVLESSMATRVGDQYRPAPTPEGAALTAQKVKGKWTSVVALRKSSMGVGFRMPHAAPRPGQRMQPPNPNDRFADLTPAQRIQRARERLGITSR